MDEHAATEVTSDLPEDKKATPEKDGNVNKLVKLRAFNLFAAKIRDSIKDENPVANGHEIKRIVGQKWAKLATEDKQEYIEEAQTETDLKGQLPVDPNAPKRRRRRRTKAELEIEDSSIAPKKRRGRPRKNGDVVVKVESNGAIPSSVDNHDDKRRMRKHWEGSGKAGNVNHFGRSGNGAAESSLDAGYLVMVRVGDTDLVFRGIVFDPWGPTRPSKTKDIASNSKLMRRNEGGAYPSHGNTGTASSSKQTYGGASGPIL